MKTFVEGLWLDAFAGLLANVDGEDRKISDARVPCRVRMKLTGPGEGSIEVDRAFTVGPATASGGNGRVGFFEHAAGGTWLLAMDLTPQHLQSGDWGRVTPNGDGGPGK